MTRYWQLAETSAARGSVLIGNLAITLMTARMLGPEGRGELVQVIVWTSTLGGFVNLSLGQLLQRRIQAGRENWQGRVVAPALALFAAMLLVGELCLWSAIALGVAPAWMSKPSLALPLSLLFPMQSWMEFAFNFFAAIDRLRFFNVCLLTSQACLLLFATFYLIGSGGKDVSVFLTIYVAGSAILPFVTCGAVARSVAWPGKAVFLAELRAFLSGAARLHPNTFTTYLLGQGHTLILSVMVTPSALAVFQLGSQLVNALQVFPVSAGLVMYGEIARRTPDDAWQQQRRFVVVLLIVFAIMCAAAAALLPILVRRLAGPAFTQSAEIGGWLLPCVWIGALPVLMTPQWITRGIFVLSSALTGVTAVIALALDYVLIPRYGIIGPVIVTYAITVLCVLPAQCLFVRYLERLSRHRVVE